MDEVPLYRAPSPRAAAAAFSRAARFRAKREHLETCQGLLPGSQGQNLTLTVSYAASEFTRRFSDSEGANPRGGKPTFQNEAHDGPARSHLLFSGFLSSSLLLSSLGLSDTKVYEP